MRQNRTYQLLSKNSIRLLLLQFLLLAGLQTNAQIKIAGNVYGGGNAGDVGGNATVSVHEGDLKYLYGGARMANVGGWAFVDINATSNLLISVVYGGNDISGTIGSSTSIPLTPIVNTADKAYIDNSFNSFIRTREAENKHLFIGRLFGGGNGDYTYTPSGTGIYDVTTKVGENTVTLATNVNKPDLSKTYLELMGGTIAHAYGGGNNVTVTDNTSICIDNASPVTTSMKKPNGEELLTDARMSEMGLNSYQTQVSSSDFQFGRVFGGNNKADMSIRPKWFLRKGQIRDLYSGGNEGNMTSTDGLLLEILADSEVKVDNIYGGCRKANVIPGGDLAHPGQATDLEGYLFPKGVGLSARVLVRGGDINNVYGGNDISGKVYGGNAIGVYTSIRGDIYGGGNGSYPYTDKAEYETDPVYGDFYYDPGSSSVDALNAFRPNAEQVSIRVAGTEAKKTVIGGAIFLGGNSATMSTTKPNPMVELKIGSYVIADNVFLGNNGANMVNSDVAVTDDGGHVTKREGVLRTLKTVNSMTLSEGDVFNKYMDGCAMTLMPSVVFDDAQKGDPATYIPYSSYIGSFYCGGNVGSMKMNGKVKIDFKHQVIIYNKVVGGCNNANVPAVDGINAAYEGGILGDAEVSTGDKLELNLEGLKIQPKRWNDDHTALVWNTNTNFNDSGVTFPKTSDAADESRRLIGGNVYGGCYNSGHVNGNVVINLNASIVDRKGQYAVFDSIHVDNEGEALLYGHEENYQIVERRSGVILDNQGMDVLGKALNVFGGGYGPESEIWGSTTINLNKGYTFQIFGGGEQGVIGKPNDGEGDNPAEITFNGKTYKYNSKYSTTINLSGAHPGVYRGHTDDKDDMAEAEFIYGGAFIGPIAGNTQINLGNGRIFNSFAGSCNADILGHTETYVGRNGNNNAQTGFPYIRDHIYGGNDLGGRILGKKDFSDRVSDFAKDEVYKVTKMVGEQATDTKPELTASAYTEFIQGRVGYIFGGCYGVYDYSDSEFTEAGYTNGDGTAKDGFTKPRLDNAFVNFCPIVNSSSSVKKIYGAGQGYSADSDRDIMQNRSYILIDAQQDMPSLEVFGAGDFSGLGMSVEKDVAAANADGVTGAAVIDLVRGKIAAAYGGSYNEGVTRRTIVNVTGNSTINIQSIFGGAYGTQILPPCDVYESNVNYRNTSEKALTGAIYGGNNNERRTLYAKVNISSPVWSDKTNGFLAKVFGAGKGVDSWSEYTEVNLESGAKVYEVYGGGELGHVLSSESVQKYMNLYRDKPSAQISHDDPDWSKAERWKGGNVGGDQGLVDTYQDVWKADWKAAWSIGNYFTPNDDYNNYVDNNDVNLSNSTIVRTAEMDDRANVASDSPIYKKYNTNVIINEGATVVNYAYGGGWGKSDTPLSGDVYGTTYVALLGGTVVKDIYAAGTSGAVYNLFGAENFTASTNAYIGGGTVRNVYGGGWEGSVGHHAGEINATTTGDILGETHVVIGEFGGTDLVHGIPAIERNAYGGGEGGAVFGTANITFNNGFIGYRYFAQEPTDHTYPYNHVGTGYYQEKIVDETFKDERGNFIPNTNLENSGNIFGGGYIDNSSVDFTNVKVYGGVVRNSVFGGGEIAAIGRGDANEDGSINGIYKAGKTHVYVYDGWVKRNVFGGGKGNDNLGRTGSLHTDGFIFGQTDVNIYGGEIGTEEGVAQGYGNVFGGGDIGCVYSAYEYSDGSLGRGIKFGTRYDDNGEGYYYKSKNGNFTDNTGTTLGSSAEKIMTEDCKVLVEPHCRVTTAGSIKGHDYAVGDYVPTSVLNTLQDKTASEWNNLDAAGIIIHNAIFAGGNVSSGSDQVYANATTLYGNATASIHDVYHRDLITIGTGHTGGLYGDGNLTFVDGYRGLNITNYGTDYYHISDDISLTDYENLQPREAAYYELKYKCKQSCTDNEGTTYSVGSTIAQDELIALFAGQTDIVAADGTVNETYWEKNGVVSRYAGRILNTIQRADFCGVWGSRMVMKGAQDRVPEIVDYTNYTINRVREVSLNAKTSIAGDATDTKHYKHGNYFGIYNIVNYLGALTSDVDFNTAVRTTDNKDDSYKSDIVLDESTSYAYGSEGATYYNWKQAHVNDRKRNNGTSHNQVALASGVYLELTTEKRTGDDLWTKDWGYITGVVELDLINVQAGIGGGFVYAKNVHGVRNSTGKTHVTLTDLNEGAVSNRAYTYTTDDNSQKEWQTSGNFVHGTQIIIDDCYDTGGKYKGSDAVPAHYWFIKGQVYVYDQYVSAYTGAPNAYSETVNIPLTITAASHGVMKLLNVQPNLYAYYSSYNNETQNKKLEGDNKLVINDVEYHLNDPISYWDWNLLNKSTERNLFVADTYVVIEDCKIGTTEYARGTVLLKSQYEALIANGKPTNVTQKKMVDGVETDVPVDFDFVFRSSNNLSHDTGYILTYNVNNPTVWNKYYTQNNGTEKITIEAYKGLSLTEQANYTDGPTYSPKTSGLYGQHKYKVSDIITKEVYDTYQAATTVSSVSIPDNQAVFEPAYVVTSYLETVKKDGTEQRLQEGAKLAKSEYNDDKWASMSGSVAAAYVCTSTIQLSKTDFIYNGELMTQEKKAALKSEYADLATDIEQLIVPAYYCSTAGNYGGNYFEVGKSYRAIEAFSSMSPEDRQQFNFNYDALDLLIDPTYGRTEGQKYQYDGFNSYSADNADKMIYSLEKPVDYTATYNGKTDTEAGLEHGKEYTRTQYEALPNEQRHYAPIGVSEAGTYYVVNSPFIIGETPYAVGMVMESSTYNSISDGTIKEKVTALTFDKTGTYYYCRESYDGTVAVTPTSDVTSGDVSYSSGTVPVGVVIDENNYSSLPNKQKNFTIHGVAPTETSTLFVSRNSDIFDLSKDKIITVIYEYNYEESDESGLHITPVSERHVVNIHLQFKSGIPTVEDITKPNVVFPGTAVTLRTPEVKPGAYEVTGGGWEIFENISDAESHTNGVEYSPSSDPLYWYQDGYYVAYYAQTYLGKTYSNHVPLSIANYHDLKKVMDDEHHLHVDYDLRRMKRESKIYINDYSSSSQNGLDLLKSLVDLTYSKSDAVSTYGALSTPTNIAGGDNLDIILRTNINHPAEWTPIASVAGECFSGTLHGDGYYIEGLNHSLFGNLCGDVYNLGVTGSFTSAGIADTGKGYVENSWVKSSATSGFASDVRAVFGKPNADSSIKQIVNCYYPAANTYSTDDSGAHGLANPMTEEAFYNGTVAYNLNGFYLYKRYCDQKLTSGVTTYQYYTIGNDNTLSDLQTGYYTDNKVLCSSGVDGGKYVEDRYVDGDYRYANGTLPDGTDGRSYTVKDANNNDVTRYAPIWPDDYLFFGQMLTYGWNESRPHEELPSHLYKLNDRLVEGDQNNRVYRAPAYYGNATMSVAHFNPNVNLVAYSKHMTPTDHNLIAAYPNMTAIDFYGYKDKVDGTSAYKLGLDGSYFYAPLLDDDGLQSIVNRDETQNLLVYAPLATSNAKTYNVLNSYFADPAFSSYYSASDNYHRVTSASTASASVFGHLVVRSESGDAFTTDRDHLLVDKQDFNCPIAYTMGADKRMWYQREPDNYVTITNDDKTIGWEGLCLPFAAELVSTQDKGEITHFYGDSKTGHEYWLRDYKGGALNPDKSSEFVGKFNAIAAGSNTKNYTNTYLWDNYYSKDSSKDMNEDIYQQGYYSTSHSYTSYPYNGVGVPYLVGFPGASYYEFDLSGQWTPQNRYQNVTIANPGRQTISFVSATGTAVGKSDTELSTQKVTADGYTYVPNYTNKKLETAETAFVLAGDGGSYVKNAANAIVSAFRPYIVEGSVNGTRGTEPKDKVERVVFENDYPSDLLPHGDPRNNQNDGTLDIYAKKQKVVVESNLRYVTDVRIVNVAGMTLSSFSIEPGETVETRVETSGVYIVYADNGKYVKKVIVK